MTGPEHYREAENFLIRGERATDGGATFFAAAQAHAMLAVAAASIASSPDALRSPGWLDIVRPDWRDELSPLDDAP